MPQALRWGVLGAGGIAATVGADIAATPGHELYAVAARDPARAAAFARAHGVTRAHESYAALVTDPAVDVVYVATTNAQHHDHALLALSAGKPVLVEKAFTLDAAQARDVVDVARANGLFCMEAMWTRFDPLVRRLVELTHDGTIGRPVGARLDLSKRFKYDPSHRLFDLTAGGGALLDLGVYVATIGWLLFGRPDTVAATGSLAPTGADLTDAIQWGYADGRVVQLYASAAGDSPFAGLVTGTDGWISVEGRVHHPARLVVQAADGSRTVLDAAPREGNGYRSEIAEVARCLRAGERESPVVPPDETVAILEVLDEARRQLGVRYITEPAVE